MPLTKRARQPRCMPFVFFAVAATGLRKGVMIVSRSVYGKAPKKQIHSNPIGVSGSGHTGKQIISFDSVIHMQESPPHKRCLVGFRSPCHSPNNSRRFALGASDVFLVKTRRAPSRHCRDARVYGHTTTAMHDMSTPPRNACACLQQPFCFVYFCYRSVW